MKLIKYTILVLSTILFFACKSENTQSDAKHVNTKQESSTQKTTTDSEDNIGAQKETATEQEEVKEEVVLTTSKVKVVEEVPIDQSIAETQTAVTKTKIIKPKVEIQEDNCNAVLESIAELVDALNQDPKNTTLLASFGEANNNKKLQDCIANDKQFETNYYTLLSKLN